MKVLIICGSPRKGNTEWMLQKLAGSLETGGANVELLLLRRKTIKRCLGCLTCEAGGVERKGVCAISDDMQEIYPRLVEADVIVLGTPAYFYMLSGLLKDFLDRTCPIWTKLANKRIAGIAVAEETAGQTISNLKKYAECCGMDWIGSVKALGKLPGDTAKDVKVARRLSRLSARILASK